MTDCMSTITHLVMALTARLRASRVHLTLFALVAPFVVARVLLAAPPAPMHMASSAQAAVAPAQGAAPAVPQAPGALHVAPPNDTCAGAEVIPPTTGTNTFQLSTAVDILDATTAGDPPNAHGFAFRMSRSVWYTFAPTLTTSYLIENTNTATTVQDTVIFLYTSTGGCAGPFVGFTGNDEPTTTGVNFLLFRHKARVFATLTAGTTYFILVHKFGLPAPLPGQSIEQLRISQTGGTATPTNTGIPGGTPARPSRPRPLLRRRSRRHSSPT